VGEKKGRRRKKENARFLLSDSLNTLQLLILQLELVQSLAVVLFPVEVELLEVERVSSSVRLREVDIVEKSAEKEKGNQYCRRRQEGRRRRGEDVRSSIRQSLCLLIVLTRRVTPVLLRLQVLNIVVALPVDLLTELTSSRLPLALILRRSGPTSSTSLRLSSGITLPRLLRGAGGGSDDALSGRLRFEGGFAFTLAFGGTGVGLATGGEGSGIGLLRASLTTLMRRKGEGEGQRERLEGLVKLKGRTMVVLG
jgi:hypothetical protein